MVCPSCGSSLEATTDKCGFCGAQIECSGSAPPQREYVGANAAYRPRFRLEPLGFGQLFDVSIKIFAGNFKSLTAISFFFLPVLIVNSLLIQGVDSSLILAGKTVHSSPLALDVVWLLSYFLIYPFYLGAISSLVSDVYLGVGPSIRRSMFTLWKRKWGLLTGGMTFFAMVFSGVTVLSIMFVSGGAAHSPAFMVTLIAAARVMMLLVCMPTWVIITGVTFFLFPMSVTLDNTGGPKSLLRVRALVRGSRFKLLLILLVTLPAFYAISQLLITCWNFVSMNIFNPEHLVGSPLGGLLLTILSPVTPLACMWLLSTFPGVILVLSYYDLRVRKEGFDMEVLAREIG